MYLFKDISDVFYSADNDLDKYPRTRLAAEFTIPITESTSRAESLYRLAEKEYERARQIDAQQDTPGRIEDFTLIKVRD